MYVQSAQIKASYQIILLKQEIISLHIYAINCSKLLL